MMIDKRHQVRHQIKMNIFKAVAKNQLELPIPHMEWWWRKEFWREFLWWESLLCYETECCPLRERGERCLFRTPKQVEACWVHSVSLMSVLRSWVDKCLTCTWRNTKLASCSGGRSKEGAAPVWGMSPQKLWDQWVHEHLQDQTWPYRRKGWQFRPCSWMAIKVNRLLIQVIVTHISSETF